MQGVTYPRFEEKRQQKPVVGSVQLPPVKMSRQPPTEVQKRQGISSSDVSPSPKMKKIHSGNKKRRSTVKNVTGSATSVEAVMEMNKKAMALMKDGKMKASYDVLQTALTAAEAGVRRFPSLPMGSNSENQEKRDAWLLAFAATLSNLGCLQRRGNQPYEAIRYLQDARNVELQVFGRPSCSTMVNLSAVLLELGSTEEAFFIARDCALSSEESDPMLHIIALHNYGVALSQHDSEEMRQLAAPVLMKALREAEIHLGEEHPTTILIRQHCGMDLKKTTDGTDTCSSNNSGAVTQLRESPENSIQPLPPGGRLPPLAPVPAHLMKAKEALQVLNYGEMPSMAQNYYSPVPDSIKALNRPESASNDGEALLSPTVAPVLRAVEIMIAPSKHRCTSNEPAAPSVEEGVEATLARQGSSLVGTLTAPLLPLQEPSNEEEEEMDEKKETEEMCEDDYGNKSNTLRAAVETLEERRAESLIDCCVTDPGKEGQEDTGVNEDASGSAHYDDDDESPMRTEEKRIDSAAVSNTFEETQRPAKITIPGEYFFIGAQGNRSEPSFYRFAPTDVSVAVNMYGGEQNVAAMKAPESTIEKETPLIDFGDEEEEEEDDYDYGHGYHELRPFEQKRRQEEGKKRVDTAEKVIEKKREVFFKLIGANPTLRRQARIQQERLEEEVLCARIRKEAEEKAKKEYFERTIEAIIFRTRDRAARKIQSTWCMWWYSVGKRRRELLVKRAEEKARRERLRQALLEHERRVEQERRRRKSNKGIFEVDIIPSVTSCGKKWLEKTLCVRYLARRGISHKDQKEDFFVSKVSKIQAIWRSYRTRGKMREAASYRAQTWVLKRQMEREVYAAMVIQMFARRCFARRAREKNFLERYCPPTIKIQRWFRSVMPCRRALGVDRVSKWRRQYSARLIQRAWRAYLSRLAYFMERLRYKLDEDRRNERVASSLLQRVGRGFLFRSYVARRWAKSANLRRTMYALEWGEKGMDEKKGGMLTVAASVGNYVPTPIEEVNAVAELEREKYHIGLFVDVVAERHRAEWKEALRLRPFEVLRRRAHEDHLCELELNASRRDRAAVKIQREFRRWLRIRDAPFSDKTLLLIARGNYQVLEYGRKIDFMRHACEQDAGRVIFGEQVALMREARAAAQAELQEVRPLVRTQVPHHEVRTREERYEVEKELQRDEHLLKKQLLTDTLRERRESFMRRAAEAGIVGSAVGRTKKQLTQ
ncbi:hypothetical protein C3747_130g40 [Trypanosoma cruzi]|uniref:IQ calmodulin-binding motif containing protein n=2 Tax=Trypanosoma cruzi TaxID=5693 RepID=Q4DIR0_TRYCC|nr:hypothetical protein, conserved [Trypanosoma cruzi]EAN92401.1 hypothetical protein, conserved [Trypanosoma cruzi]PWV05481.1 hypothetical protein C3747_130g40 [Trypanosoma cruzi]|eukprot:XP_814252.1 hypothetical protein [Trypanosoma cruzi strain CL Brener]